MSKTPRTDALLRAILERDGQVGIVLGNAPEEWVKLARLLEEELAENTGELTAWAADALNCRQAIYKLMQAEEGTDSYARAVEYAELCLRMGKAKGAEQ